MLDKLLFFERSIPILVFSVHLGWILSRVITFLLQGICENWTGVHTALGWLLGGGFINIELHFHLLDILKVDLRSG